MKKMEKMEITKKILQNYEERKVNFPFYIIPEHFSMCVYIKGNFNLTCISGKVFPVRTILIPYF